MIQMTPLKNFVKWLETGQKSKRGGDTRAYTVLGKLKNQIQPKRRMQENQILPVLASFFIKNYNNTQGMVNLNKKLRVNSSNFFRTQNPM